MGDVSNVNQKCVHPWASERIRFDRQNLILGISGSKIWGPSHGARCTLLRTLSCLVVWKSFSSVGLPVGNYELCAVADSTNVVEESDERNTKSCRRMTVRTR